jgi:hypothetical protein
MTFGMVRVGVIVTDWQALPPVLPVPPVPPVPMFGTQRPRVVLQVEPSPQPSVAVQFATHLLFWQKLASHWESEVQVLSQSGGGTSKVAQVRTTPPLPPVPLRGPLPSPPQARKTRPLKPTNAIESDLRICELLNTKKPTMLTFYNDSVAAANRAER